MADGTPKVPPAFDAAGQGRRLLMFRPPNHGPNANAQGASTVLARVRHLVRNNPWAGTSVERSVSNGVGCGIQAKPVWGTKAQKAEQKRLWNKSVKVMDADGVLDLYGIQALAWREWREAGEVFARIRSRLPEDGLPVPMQVQLIESEQCPRDMVRRASNGNSIEQGIEFDRIRRRVAYWMHPRHPGDAQFNGNYESNEPVRIPAEQILHLYRPSRAGEIRGTSSLAAGAISLYNLDKLSDNLLELQSLGALFSGFFTRKTETGDDAVAGDIVNGVDDDGTPLAGLEPGTMQELPAGMDVKFSTPPTPGDTYADFMRGGLMAFASRAGIPYEILTGDIRDISDRALRLILNEFRRLVEMDQWLYMIPQLCSGIRNAWFDAGVLSGALSIPGYGDIRDDVVETIWVPQGFPYSHPVQDVDADIKAIRAGLESRAAVVMSNGEDIEEVDEQQVEDNARADALGLAYDSDGRRSKGNEAAPKAAAKPDPNEDTK